MAYTPKDWVLGEAISDTDMDRIETGIDTLATALSTVVDFEVVSNTAVTVTASIDTYAQPGTPIQVFSITPTFNARLLLGGFVTLRYGSNEGTPDLSWAIKRSTGDTLVVGAVANRSRESMNQPVCLPIGGVIEISANTTMIGQLAVSSSASGTVTVVGGGRTHITGLLLPI